MTNKRIDVLDEEVVKKTHFIIEDGKIKGIQGIGGADTVIPFNGGGKARVTVNTYVAACYGDVSFHGRNNTIGIEVDFEKKTISKISSNDGNWIRVFTAENGAGMYFNVSSSVSAYSFTS